MLEPYYQDELVTLYHGDCRDVDAWLEADVLITDPPYGIGWAKGNNRAAGSRAHAGIANDHDTSVRDGALALWAPRPAVVFGSFYAPHPDGLRQVLVWKKPADAGVVGSVTGYRRDAEPVFLCGDWPQRTIVASSVLESCQQGISAVAARTGHPHTKPLDLMQSLIGMAPEGVVADPFAGSGTTLCAAKTLGRRVIGVEIEERYCEIAAKRLAQGVLDLWGVA